MLCSILQQKCNTVWQMTTIKLLLLQLFFSIIKRSGSTSQGEAGNASGNSENRHRTYTRPSKDPSSTGVIHCTTFECFIHSAADVYLWILMRFLLPCSSHLKNALQKRSFFWSGKICACQSNSLTQSSLLETSLKISIGCSFLLSDAVLWVGWVAINILLWF